MQQACDRHKDLHEDNKVMEGGWEGKGPRENAQNVNKRILYSWLEELTLMNCCLSRGLNDR